jgi:undecaprenyl-diphosphatase
MFFLLRCSIFIANSLGYISKFICLVIFILFAFTKEKIAVIWSSFVLGVTVNGNSLIKIIIDRVRPEGHRLPLFAHQTENSFASGHVTFYTTILGCLLFIVFKKLKSRIIKSMMGIIVFLIISLVMLSRVLIGVHYPSDTIGSFLWSGAILCFTFPLFSRFDRSVSWKQLAGYKRIKTTRGAS